MWIILFFYAVMASTFTFAKAAVFYLAPFYLIGIRMTLAGTLLLGYLYATRASLKIEKSHWPLFIQVIAFHIYGAYLLEFWAIQYTTSAKACLLYNLAPFFTALLSLYLFKERLTGLQWIALILGFIGMIPIMLSCSDFSSLCQISIPECALLFSVLCAAYGWILMKQLVSDRHYSPLLVNGIGMFFGGIAALATSFLFETNRIRFDVHDNAAWGMFGFCLISLILLANIIGYNWYGYLLKRYSATLLSLFGLTAPFFAAFYGWIFLHEAISNAFLISALLTGASIYLFNKK
jgi:drug/metabolite transporter (DMT)-like permease